MDAWLSAGSRRDIANLCVQVDLIPGPEIYLAAAYWSLTAITTIGFGDITPITNAERAVMLLVEILGVLFFGILLGSITSLLQVRLVPCCVLCTVQSCCSAALDNALPCFNMLGMLRYAKQTQNRKAKCNGLMYVAITLHLMPNWIPVACYMAMLMDVMTETCAAQQPGVHATSRAMPRDSSVISCCAMRQCHVRLLLSWGSFQPG